MVFSYIFDAIRLFVGGIAEFVIIGYLYYKYRQNKINVEKAVVIFVLSFIILMITCFTNNQHI